MPDSRSRFDTLVAGVLAAVAAGVFFFTRDLPYTLRLDNEMVHYPMTLDAYRRWTTGAVPAWSDGLWSGFPLLADPVTAGFYPLHLPVFLATPDPHLRAFDLSTALHAGVLVAGVVAVLGALGAARGARVLGALLTFFAAQFHWWVNGFLPSFASLAWWPWGILAAEELATPDRAVGPIALLGSAALAAEALAGYPEFALYGGSVAVLWLVTRGHRLPLARRLGRAVLLVAPAIMLAAPQILPTAFDVRDSTRATRLPWASFDAAPVALTPYVNPFPSGGKPFFLGVATIVLAATGLLRRVPRGVFLALLALITTVIAFGDATPLYGLLVRVPPFHMFRSPAKFLNVTELALVLLAALGFGALLASPRRGVRTLALALAVFAVGERALYTGLRYAQAYVPLSSLERPLDLLLATLRDDVAPFATAPDEDGVPPRVYFEAWLHRYGNLPMLYGVESTAGGVTALMSPRHGKLLRPPLDRPIYDLAGVGLVFVPGVCPSPEQLARRRMTLEHAGEHGCLLRNSHRPHRYEFLRIARPVASMDAMVEFVHDNPSGVVLPVLGPPEEIARRTLRGEPPGGIEVLAYRPGDVTLATTATRDRLLLVRESWKQGWTAEVDGAPLPVWQAASIFFAVPVPGGSHVVRLRYHQPGLATGLALAGTWVVLAIVVFVRRRRARDT